MSSCTGNFLLPRQQTRLRLNEFGLLLAATHRQPFNQLFVSAFSGNQNADARTVLVRTPERRLWKRRDEC